MLNTLVTAIVISVIFQSISGMESIRRQKVPWGWAVTIVYIVAVVVIFTLLALGGIAIFDQIQNFINFLQSSLVEITNFFDTIAFHGGQYRPVHTGFFLHQLERGRQPAIVHH